MNINSIILKLFGIESQASRAIEKIVLSFLKPWPLFIALISILGIIVLISLLYRFESKPITGKLKVFLTALRILSLLILVMIIFEPIVIIHQSTDEKPRLITIVDNSMSMGINDPGMGKRVDLVNKVFADKELNLINKLGEKYDLKFMAFSSEIDQVELKTDQNADKSKKTGIFIPPVITVNEQHGQKTQLGDALAKALFELKESSAGAVILFTDGGSNFGEDPIAAAHGLESASVPVYVVGVGDPKPPRDIKLSNVFANPIVHAGDRVVVNIDVVNTGYKGVTVPIRIIDKKNRKVVQDIKRPLGEEKEKQRIDIGFDATREGEFEYEVLIPAFSDEISDKNNSQNFHIKVEKKKTKVLYVDGFPRWLYRFLKNMMYREKSLDFSVLLESADESTFREGTKPIRSFPKTESSDSAGSVGLFDYDIIIIGDVTKSYFTDSQYKLIERFVKEHEGGLMVIGGEMNGTPSSFAGTPLANILPVNLEGAKSDGNKFGTNGNALKLASTVSSDNFLHLIGESSSTAKFVWEMFRFYWCADVRDIKQTSICLATVKAPEGSEREVPVVVIGKYGLGNTLYLGVDELWRMRREVEDKYFAPLFGQAIRWLAPRRFAGEKFVSIETDEKEVIGGQKVTIHARLLSKAYTPLPAKEVPLKISCNDEQPEDVPLYLSSQDGVYSGEYLPQRAGKYTMWFGKSDALENLGEEPGKTKESFFVKIPNLEFENPELNEDLLKKIAEITSGKYYKIDKMKDLAKVILSANAKIIIRDQKELHDSPLFALAMIAFFSVEWFLRRRRGLS